MKDLVFINEELKTFIWLPPRSASTLCWRIFEKLGFSYKFFNEKTKKFESYDYKFHNHFHLLFEGNQNFKLITLLRNPYSTLVSKYRVTGGVFNGNLVDEERYERFEHFLQNVFLNKPSENDTTWWFRPTRNADYFIRQESIFEDICKIPFVTSSRLYESGELETMCSTPMHTIEGDKVPWREFYNQSRADIVYYNTANYFERHRYKKDSWKG